MYWEEKLLHGETQRNSQSGGMTTVAAWLALRGASAGGFVFSTRGLTRWVYPRRAHTPALCHLESADPPGTV